MSSVALAQTGNVIRRDGVEFEPTWYGMRITVTDYQAGPVLLRGEELAELGIRIERPGEAPSQIARGAKGTEAKGEAPALAIGGLLLVPVQEGLDVFVTSYDAEGARMWAARLERLGLVSIHAL